MSRTRSAEVLTALVWLGAIVGLTLAWAQPHVQPTPNSVSQSTAPASPNTTDQRSSESSGWHHFGESPSAPSAEPRQSGGWRHFGDGGGAPPSLPEVPARQSSGRGRAGGMEQLMWELVNRDRADPANAPETHGRGLPLRWNDRLAVVARAHSLEMLNQGYFAHMDPRGRSVAGRIEAAGMQWQAVGENIAIYTTVARAEAAFMNEPRFTQNHRANILSPDFTDVGIGIVTGPDGRLYITQDFYAAPSHLGASAALPAGKGSR
ncbi:MAG: CAP domain-containing protein [Terriglobia bacterium]